MPSVVDLVDVTEDLARGTWRVGVGDTSYAVREWTWGERRRLIAGAVRTGPALDADAFVAQLLAVLVTPVPPHADRALLAAVALRLCGVDPDAHPASLLDAEARLAREWGWGPAELDHQPAPRIDEHLRAGSGAAPGGAEPPWTGVIVVDDGT